MIINVNSGINAEYVSEFIERGGVSKVGLLTVGNPTDKPIYLNAGVPTVMTKTMVNVEDVQTITGAKTFGGTVAFTSGSTPRVMSGNETGLYIQNTNLNLTNPDNRGSRITMYGQGTLLDSERFAMIRAYARTNGSNSLYFNIFGKHSTGITAAGIEITTNNSTYGDAVLGPTPVSAAPSTAFTTIGYVSDTSGSLNNLVHTNGNESISGIKSFSNYIKGQSYPVCRRAPVAASGWIRVLKIPKASQYIMVIKIISNSGSIDCLIESGSKSVKTGRFGSTYAPEDFMLCNDNDKDNYVFMMRYQYGNQIFVNILDAVYRFSSTLVPMTEFILNEIPSVETANPSQSGEFDNIYYGSDWS